MSLSNLWRRLFDNDVDSPKTARRRQRSHPTNRRRLAVQPLEDRRLLSIEPNGPEFLVNTYTTSVQTGAAIAVDGDGDFVVAWASNAQDGDTYGIFAQRYNSAGVAQGNEFQVNTYTTKDQRYPSVAMDDGGAFVITWQSEDQDGSSYGVYAQRYNASGSPQGGEFRVNTTTASWQAAPSAAMDADGDFAIAWEASSDGNDLGVFAQRYNASGTAQGSEFQVNTYSTSRQDAPSIAMDDSGDFMVAWRSLGQDAASTYGIYAQRYNSSGTAQGGEFAVNTYTTSNQSDPSVAMDANGNFVIAWESSGQDGSNLGVYAQRYNTSGTAQGGEFLVNTYRSGQQSSPSAAMDSDGDFVIAWESDAEDSSSFGVYSQRYNALGTAQDSEFRINTYTANAQYGPSVAMEADGDFVTAWESGGQDGSSNGIYAQQFRHPPEPVGPEFAVNTATTNVQQYSSVAADADGDFVIVWTSYQDGGSYGVYGQRYNAAGVAQGNEFRVNTTTANSQFVPSVGMDTDGDFVVAWQSWNQDGSNYGVYAQRYNASGTAQGNEFLVNTYTAGSQVNPSVAVDGAGNFVIAWTNLDTQDGSGYGVYAQRYNASGTAQGGEFRVNTSTTGNQSTPSVAIDVDGDFVIAWSGAGTGDSAGVFAQRYNASGTAQGGEFRVNTQTTDSQSLPAAAMDADGGFVIAWTSLNQDGQYQGIYAQRYNASGTAQGNEFLVNTYTTSVQESASIAMDADGDFVIAWESASQDGSGRGIYGQRYNASGTAQGGEFRVNSYTTGDQFQASVAMDSDGDFIIAWTSDGQDGSDYGVYAQRFG